jgi:hypothetical protein
MAGGSDWTTSGFGSLQNPENSPDLLFQTGFRDKLS